MANRSASQSEPGEQGPTEERFERDPAGYIELERRFIELERSSTPEAAAQSSYLELLHGHSEGLGWEELLQRRLVVILGEPGSGKSYELQHRFASRKRAIHHCARNGAEWAILDERPINVRSFRV